MTEQTERALVWWVILLSLVLFWAAISYVLYPAIADAQEWHTANQLTVAWNPVTKLADDRDVPTDNSIEYALYLVNAVTDPQKGNPALIHDNISGTSQVITLNTEGQYLVGFQTIRKIADGTEVARSTLAWSEDPAVAPVPFGVKFFAPPKVVTGANVPGG